MARSQHLRTVHLDKIASVTLNCRLGREVKVGDDYPCQAGDVLALRVIDQRDTYNTLELTTGRMSPLASDDVIVGALGHRSATQGHAGRIPTSLGTGDVIQILNLGGVVGQCTSSSPMVGAPINCEVLGQVLGFPYLGQRVGVPENVSREAKPVTETLTADKVPVIAVIGTSMNSGKTEACLRLVQWLTHKGLKVAAGKATGVSLRRDILAMEDAGASSTTVFTDFGTVTTDETTSPTVCRSILNELSSGRPDAIVLELGDGLFGSYGVRAILADQAISSRFSSIVLAASDPVAAWGGVIALRDEHGLVPTIVTGPATDNEVGAGIVAERTSLPCANARTNPALLAQMVWEAANA